MTLSLSVAERKKTVAARLARYQRENNLTQEAASEQAGVSVRQWQRWVSGETTPRLSTLQAVAKKLKIPLAEFIPDPVNHAERRATGTAATVEERLAEMERLLRELMARLPAPPPNGEGTS